MSEPEQTAATPVDIGQQEGLFDLPAPDFMSLADRFLVPPFSVLDARSGYWQDRKNHWLKTGLTSELGRADKLLGFESIAVASDEPCPKCNGTGGTKKAGDCRACHGHGKKYGGKGYGKVPTTSVFDPVLCEVCYRWWAPPGGLVYDPFAGGSVRGVVAARLGYEYLGVDLRPEQVEANQGQAEGMGAAAPWLGQPPGWVTGDSRDTPAILGARKPDFIFSCPPYYDLEQYSDDPADLSNAESYDEFLEAYEQIIEHCYRALAPDRFAAFVIGEVRDKSGGYVGLVPDTAAAFMAAGFSYYNELVLLTPVGSAPIRTGSQFGPGRKVGKVHQNVLVFCKGDWRAAAAACGAIPDVDTEVV